jgi:hypothetical protein
MTQTDKMRKEIERQKEINSSLKELKELSKEKERLKLEFKMLKNENTPRTNWGKIGSELKGMGNKLMEVAHEGRESLEKKDKNEGGLFKW